MNPMPELAPMLKQLRLSGILDSIESRNRQAIENKMTYMDFLATIITDEIDTFTETGLSMKSGATVDADIIITATRRDTALQSTPVSVSVVDDALIDQAAPNDIGDLAVFVPNFSAETITGFNAASSDTSAESATARAMGCSMNWMESRLSMVSDLRSDACANGLNHAN